jgi:hypothetical protein
MRNACPQAPHKTQQGEIQVCPYLREMRNSNPRDRNSAKKTPILSADRSVSSAICRVSRAVGVQLCIVTIGKICRPLKPTLLLPVITTAKTPFGGIVSYPVKVYVL